MEKNSEKVSAEKRGRRKRNYDFFLKEISQFYGMYCVSYSVSRNDYHPTKTTTTTTTTTLWDTLKDTQYILPIMSMKKSNICASYKLAWLLYLLYPRMFIMFTSIYHLYIALNRVQQNCSWIAGRLSANR